MVSASRICTCAMAGDVSRTTATGIRYFNLRLLCRWVHILPGVSLSDPCRISWPEAPPAFRPPPLGCACRGGDIGRWPIAHSAIRPHRGVAPCIPVCPSREHVAPQPLRRIALWSVLRGKTIPPLHPSPASGRDVCLLVSGKPAVNHTHTHMSAEAYPPDGPRISPRQGSQNFSSRAGRVGRSVQCAPPRWRRRRASKTFAPGKPAASPSLTRANSENRTFGHATTLTWWFPEHLETPT